MSLGGEALPYVRLALEDAGYEFDMPYEYRVPEGMKLEPGMRVLVPFGRGNKKCCGVVLALSDKPTAVKHKLIAEMLDAEPLLDETLLKIAMWLHKTVYCSVWQAICAMLPAGLRHARTECVILTNIKPGEVDVPPGDARVLYEALLGSKERSLPRAALMEALEGRDPAPAIKTLAALGLCESTVVARRRVSDKSETLVSLAVPPEEAGTARSALRSARQKDALDALIQNGPLTMSELRYLTGAAPVSLRRLEELSLIETSEVEAYRRPEVPSGGEPPAMELSQAQSAAAECLYTLLEAGTPACALLHGVTGSGKTNVYIALIRRAIERGGTCLVLAPEIALTPQLMERFATHFGDRVAILHSGLSLGERMDEWKRVRAGLCDVVVGTRSAVFAPLSRLSLIILDEEHETSYKSESAPRYHAREVAKFRAVQNSALLVLGSATPSLESMYAAQCGQYTYIELPGRYQDRPLPAVQLADMAAELRAGNMSCIGGALYRELRENLKRGEQSILFLNRRGASRYVVCADCRTAPECPRCSRSLVYHSTSGRLHCHLCGHSEKLGETCTCGGELKTVGAGTQKVVEELAGLFPNTQVLRLDADTTMRKGSAQKILKEFAERSVPILVGTQMVAKGLDFPGVTLVGVVNADAALWASDFRAHEKTFSLITQVVGRGGRGSRPGRAILQSYSGIQPTLAEAAAQDYHRFYERELELRRLLKLPPFTVLTRLCLFGTRQDEVLKACLRTRGWLERWIHDHCYEDAILLGPAPASVLKVNLRYRYHLTLVAERRETLRTLTASVMTAFPKDKQNRGVGLYADPDAEEN